MNKKRLVFIVAFGFLLRTFAVGKFPSGFYSDEAAFGYNAYLLLTSGHDEYGRFWPMSLESFGDWKPPMQAWLAIPFIALLGLNEVAVRLPSVLLGTATIVIIYFLTDELFRPRLVVSRWRLTVGEIASFLLAISPWHIFMSRMAMLVSIEVFFVSLGLLGLLKGMKKSHWWIVAALSFAGATYSYYGSRITVPLLLLAFVFSCWLEVKSKFLQFIIPTIIGGLLLAPLFVAAIHQPLVLTGRAKTTSVFFNDNVRLQLWAAHTTAGLSHVPPVISRFFDNKPYYYARDILGRWVSHFSPEFLFFVGDIRPPFTLAHLGVLHLVDLPFFLIGLVVLRSRLTDKNTKKYSIILLLYFLFSPLVASLTFLTPAANRSFNLVIPWTIITAVGLGFVIQRIQFGRSALLLLVAGGYLISLGGYSFSYLSRTPQTNPREWLHGRRELIAKLSSLAPQYSQVIMSNNGGPPYIFLSFYLKIPYSQFMNTVARNPIIDELGWGHVDRLLNVTIPRQFEWGTAPKIADALYVGFEEELSHEDVTVIDRAYYPNGQVAYELGTLKKK